MNRNDDGLARIGLFAGLDQHEVEALAARAHNKHYPAHTLLAVEGGQSDFLFVILSGSVKIYVSDDDGAEVILAFMGPGDFFGEMALIDNGERCASAMTLEPSRVLSISKTAFRECLTRNPDIAVGLIKTLSGRVRLLNDNVKSLALLDVYGRVARALLQMARPDGEQLVVAQRLTHQDIASMVGSSREMVSRILKDLERGGYIGYRNKHIVIHEKLPRGY